ncbi:hypothetical protein JXA47_02300 [Candidatus Sumerlaeota bacterium]|nr:hypothetical protein [Candidatus Sumerlaeota bacterium]
MTPSLPRGNTRIDILAVMLIIAAVAAAASVDFVESLTRSRVARTQADLRELAVAIDAYVVDHLVPPNDIGNGWPWYVPEMLTTPVGYLSSPRLDPFRVVNADGGLYHPSARRYRFINCIAGRDLWCDYGTQFGSCSGGVATGGWILGVRDSLTDEEWNETLLGLGNWKLSGVGPDGTSSFPFLEGYLLYDPTNGTISTGDIVHTDRLGPVLP